MKIKEETLEDILQVSKEAYPREVGGILLGKKQVDGFVLIPGRFTSSSVSVKLNQLPIYVNKKGTFHSHPSPSANPSKADISFFSKMGSYHMIIAKPFTEDKIKAYNNKGEEIKIEKIGDEDE
ncbi:MAG: Mov34/MPN/PAD-1 family protein [archaeon]